MSNMKNIPGKIYLQIGDECDSEDFNELSEVSWCKDKIYDNDIEFTLQNKVSEKCKREWEEDELANAYVKKRSKDGFHSGKVSDISAEEIKQEFKELNIYQSDIYDYYIRHNGKDSGNLWIQFSDKLNAFEQRLINVSIVNERKELCAYEILCVVDEILLEKSKEAGLHVDFSDNDYNGDKDAPMDRIGLIDYLFEKVNEKDNIPADSKQVTGHNSPKEMIAYEKGREDEQEVIMKWIEQWDGSSNSAMGTLLKKKFDERKDNAGSCENSNEVLNEVLGIAVKAHLFQQLNQMDDFIEEIEKFKNFEIKKK